jgi:hypothetical protein
MAAPTSSGDFGPTLQVATLEVTTAEGLSSASDGSSAASSADEKQSA